METLYPKKSSAIWLLLGCIVFVAGGLLMVKDKGWVGYLCAGFFALGIPVAIVQLLPGSTYLKIEKDGLTFANMYRVTHVPWNVVDQFFVVTLKQTGMNVHKMVAFNFVETYDRAKFSRKLNSAVAQCEGALPNTYGKKAEELAELLNEKLRQFRASEAAKTW